MFYCDASVIAGLALGDITAAELAGVAGNGATLIYSGFGLGETVSAIAARARLARLSDTEAELSISELRQFLLDWRKLGFEINDIDRSIMLCAKPSLALKFSDALHVVAAERAGAPLLTADQQQARAAATLALAVKLIPVTKR